MVKDGKMFKAKKRKGTHDVRHLKAALNSMPKPVHPKKGSNPNLSNGQKKVEAEEPPSAPPVEIQFAQKLASNDPIMRNRAVKKLKRWLEARSSADSGEGFNEVEMMRLWKGLHYCFWMSDKPLIQEELAESIGSMVTSFGSNESAALLFASSFMRTMGREWVGIDRWRMDKFMMLVRRVLRYCFCFLAKFDWREDLVAKWSDLCEKQVVSANTIAQLLKMKKKKRKRKFQETEIVENGTENHINGNDQPTADKETKHVFHTSLGFQLHFVDIFLEELAKIGGEELSPETIQTLITPFIAELAKGDDDRLSQHIEERIFHHLMRQSDVGIAYEEASDDDDDEEMDEGDDDVSGDEENNVVVDDDEDYLMDESVKDPRAGKVDVVLPQLQPDFEKLADALFLAGSAKEVSKQQRDRLYRLTKQLKALASGAYPLAMELSDDEDELPKKINVAKAAKKAAEEDFLQMVKGREERKKFKLEIKEKQKAETLVPAANQEVKMIDENQESEEEEEEEEEVVEEVKPKGKKKRDRREEKKQKAKKKAEKATVSNVELKTDSPKSESPKQKKENEKKQVVKTSSDDVPQQKEVDSPNSESPKKKKKKNKKKKSEQSPTPSSPLILSLTPEQKSQIEKKKKEMEEAKSAVELTEKKSQKKNQIVESKTEKTETLILNLTSEKKVKKKKQQQQIEDASEEVITISKKSAKKRKTSNDDESAQDFFNGKKKSATPNARLIASELLTHSLPTKAGLKKKRINFSLMENKCSSLQDIDRSILDSPEIPFHADKKPKQGVLKKTGQSSSVNNTPTGSKADKQSVAYNTLLNGRSTFMKRRAFASDFF